MKTTLFILSSAIILIISCKTKDITPINPDVEDTTDIDTTYLHNNNVVIYNQQSITYTYNQDYKVRKAMVDSYIVDFLDHIKNGLTTLKPTHYVGVEVSITDYIDEDNFNITNVVKIVRSYHNGDKDYFINYQYQVENGLMIIEEYSDFYPYYIVEDENGWYKPINNPLKIRYNNTELYHIEYIYKIIGEPDYRITIDLVSLIDSSDYKNNTNGIERLVITLENGRNIHTRRFSPVDFKQGGYVEYIIEGSGNDVDWLQHYKATEITLNDITYRLSDRQSEYFMITISGGM